MWLSQIASIRSTLATSTKMPFALRSQIEQSSPGLTHHLKVLFNRYYWRKVGLQWMKHKGAILVLIWFLLVQSGYYLIRHKITWQITVSDIAVVSIGLMIVVILSPIAGWLADVYFGRYKVIKWSIWILWSSSLLLTISSVIADLVSDYEHAGSNIVDDALVITMAVSLVGFASNLLQFSMDQLTDASTEEIVSFIRWMAWTIFSSAIALNYCLFCVEKKYELIGFLVVTTFLTLAVCLDSLFNHHLIKEPVTGHPFRLVFSVLKYATKTKQPRFRSAFTFHEDEPPSRIDFSKKKYGGPFTTEQVEDVKTFLRLILVIAVSGALPGPTFFLEYAESKLINQFLSPREIVEGCYIAKDLSLLYFGFGFTIIPLYDLIIRPLFYRCIPEQGSYCKILVGFAFLLLTVLTYMSIDLYANQVIFDITHNKTCIFSDENGMLKGVLDYRWFSLLEVMDCLFTIFVFIGTVEFLCSQVPHSMKGIFAGIFISILSVFTILGVVIFIPFVLNRPTLSNGALTCGFWCFFSEAITISTGLLLSVVVVKWYKKRRREDVLPNEHIFAERYYSS